MGSGSFPFFSGQWLVDSGQKDETVNFVSTIVEKF